MEKQNLFNERLGRYQAAIALEPTDRIPIAPGTNYFAETYAGFTNQDIIYDSEKWLQAEIAFCKDFPGVDVLRNNRIWGPLYDAVGNKIYKLPGRDLPKNVQLQFVEDEYMKADEYDMFIRNPVEFMMECFLPRISSEFSQKGSMRSQLAMLKGGMAYMMMSSIMKNRALYLEKELGMPQPTAGWMLAPFDVFGDCLRGLQGMMLDIFRQPDKILEACESVIPHMVNSALSVADPLKRYPIFMPLHKAIFLTPKQFEEFYWPSLKKAMLMLIEAGYTIRAYLEGDWGPYWHYLLELPKGKLVCDIDNQGDIFRAKKEIGHHVCLAGGIPDSMFILGSPEGIRERVKLLCETVGQDGGFIINGGCNIPYQTKPENFQAMIDAILKYGRYSDHIKPMPKEMPPSPAGIKGLNQQYLVTPWEVKKAELGGIMGDEEVICSHWEQLEKMAFNWFWIWAS
jgi:uroporphyrinogen-III decarboxylase